jgi:glycosyltransferase involved in cell wall biosynthesis
VITSLDTGGAEMLLARLLERSGDDVEAEVICLKGWGAVADLIARSGVTVQALELRKRPLPADVAKLRRAIRDAEPDVVQTWMLHANVLGAVATRIARVPSNGKTPVVWGVHVSEVDRAVLGRAAAVTQRAEWALSRALPERIIACSQSALDVMRGLHYPEGRLELIPNGFDLQRFHPDAAARAAVRSELEIGDDALIVGHVARFHPIKDHRTLLAAARLVSERVPAAHFVLCGAGIDDGNAQLREWAAPLGGRLHLLGERSDVARLCQAFDVAVSSSVGEALPLAVGEAMACEIPVAATDTGDTAQMVGDTGRVVAVRDPAALSNAIAELLEASPEDRRLLGQAARRRIHERYDLDEMVARYVAVWRQVAAPASAG